MTNELSVLNQQLLEKYGPMIGGKDLYMVLAQWLLSLTQARDSRAHERELEM